MALRVGSDELGKPGRGLGRLINVTESAEPADPLISGSGGGSTSENPARLKIPSQQDLDALPADRRLELLELERQRREAACDRRRQSAHQWINSGVLLVGVVLAGGSLLATGLTLHTGQQELRTAKEGQVTNRYIQAVEQLGSPKRDEGPRVFRTAS